MNSRKLYLSLMSAGLVGVGAFFLLREIVRPQVGLSISIILALGAAVMLFTYASHLASRPARAFIGLALVFGAICFGAQDGGTMLAPAVLWAGVLFGAVDSLGKTGSPPKKEDPASEKVRDLGSQTR